MQAVRKTGAVKTFSSVNRVPRSTDVSRRFQSSNPSTQSQQPFEPSGATKRSSAFYPALAVVGAVAAILAYNSTKTGKSDNIAKAMARTPTPANTDPGWGKMQANHELQMGGKDLKTEPEDKRPPSKR